MVEFARYKDILFVEKPRNESSDAFNQVDLSNDANWVELFNRRGSIEPSQGREFLTGAQPSAEVSHLVKLRFDDETKEITPKYRFRLGVGVSRRVFGIVSRINVDEGEREIEFRCIEQVA